MPSRTNVGDNKRIFFVCFFLHLQEGLCESREQYIGRGNAFNIDLNRDFPDRFEAADLIRLKQSQAETVAMMKFINSYPFVLSANFHGGAVVSIKYFLIITDFEGMQNMFEAWALICGIGGRLLQLLILTAKA